MSLIEPSPRGSNGWGQISGQAPLPTAGPTYVPFAGNQFSPPNVVAPTPQSPQGPFSHVVRTGALGESMLPAVVSGQLADVTLSPVATRQLEELQPNVARTKTGALRDPMVIRGDMQRTTDPLPPTPQHKRRLLIHLVIAGFLIFSLIIALVAFSPVGHSDSTSQVFSSSSSSHQVKNGNSSLLYQQRAAATALMADGYDAGSNNGLNPYAPVPPAWAQADPHLSRFYYGQCTFWANYRYHLLTGRWVPWLGNAWEWKQQAINYGWNVSQYPHVPSIIVLQPYDQLAGGYGHVAVVEAINGDGTVTTTNWNWAYQGATTVKVNFSYPDPNATFIWAQGE